VLRVLDGDRTHLWRLLNHVDGKAKDASGGGEEGKRGGGQGTDNGGIRKKERKN